MKDKGWVVFTALLDQHPPDAQQELLQHLSEEERQALGDTASIAYRLDGFVANPLQRMDQVHYSWLVPLLKPMAPAMQKVLCSALSEEISVQICIQLEMKEPLPKPAPSVRFLLLHYLLSKLQPEKVMPRQSLPLTPLTDLLELPKAQLIQLIDFLGIQSLAVEMQQTLNKSILQKARDCLSPVQQKFLDRCLQTKVKVAGVPSDLLQWMKTPQEFTKRLHERGLLRMAHALQGEDASFLWHLSHKLDVGRGRYLESQFAAQAARGTVASGRANLPVLELLHLFQKGSA